MGIGVPVYRVSFGHLAADFSLAFRPHVSPGLVGLCGRLNAAGHAGEWLVCARLRGIRIPVVMAVFVPHCGIMQIGDLKGIGVGERGAV